MRLPALAGGFWEVSRRASPSVPRRQESFSNGATSILRRGKSNRRRDKWKFGRHESICRRVEWICHRIKPIRRRQKWKLRRGESNATRQQAQSPIGSSLRQAAAVIGLTANPDEPRMARIPRIGVAFNPCYPCDPWSKPSSSAISAASVSKCMDVQPVAEPASQTRVWGSET